MPSFDPPSPPPAAISGTWDSKFEPVRDAFEKNFSRRGEVGAAVAVMVEGELVVDLWGGWADADHIRPWQADTLVSAQSTTKGLVAVLFHWLAEQGALDWDRPVSDYWPEFAGAGKDRITTRALISHQAGLCVIDMPLPPGATLDWSQMVGALEAQTPVWPPGTRFGYHAITWSFLMGELAWRITGEHLPGCLIGYLPSRGISISTWAYQPPNSSAPRNSSPSPPDLQMSPPESPLRFANALLDYALHYPVFRQIPPKPGPPRATASAMHAASPGYLADWATGGY